VSGDGVANERAERQDAQPVGVLIGTELIAMRDVLHAPHDTAREQLAWACRPWSALLAQKHAGPPGTQTSRTAASPAADGAGQVRGRLR
jgi:hypothetical protein